MKGTGVFLFYLLFFSINTLCVAPGFEVVQLDPVRWEEYKKLRLESLQKYPENFRATYKKESAYPDSQWQAWLRDAQTESGTVFLFAQNGVQRLIGMGGGRPEKSSRTATIFSLYVVPEEQRRGIASCLLKKILAKLEERGIISVNLMVNANNKSAQKVYEQCGFVITGFNKELKDDGTYREYFFMNKVFD